ncbi:hypothetical protein U5A82_17365 [Sphingobium sp. CR2-8]|uniref:hypothetical protein n=1 Tax=Sphingobium sp. CR2-8 TaxID=1306534 RepID=UPI002DBE842A|nr:hypothetical protein [Sphingobium sp. CR2-8]MEC3912178.1 hypothetical protein [Sphingobium sp. CR2-8]
MADIYTRMQATARRLLAPTDQGGLGQGEIAIVRYVAGEAPANPWEPPSAPTLERIPLDGAARGVGKELVGTPVENGGQIVATDLLVIVAVPESGYNADDYEPADVLEIDGAPVTVMSVKNIPAAGTPCVIQFVARQ